MSDKQLPAFDLLDKFPHGIHKGRTLKEIADSGGKSFIAFWNGRIYQLSEEALNCIQ